MKSNLDKLILNESNFDSSQITLCDKSIKLIEIQLQTWELLKENYRELSKVETKNVTYGNAELEILHHPKRILSSAAKTDEKSVRNRECFLCSKNFPEQQRGLKYFFNYLILANPYPIKPYHLTISKIEHTPQNIYNGFDDLLNLSKELSCNFSLFYNGPNCGASAPDHMHFQALPKNSTPIERAFKNKSISVIKSIRYKKAKVDYTTNDFRNAIIISSQDRENIKEIFFSCMKLLEKFFKTDGEPLVNLLCFFENREWNLILFIRSKHRPRQYFMKETKKFLFSPAAIDLAGCLIFPNINDFNRIDVSEINDMLSQVIIASEQYYFIQKKMESLFLNPDYT